MFFRNLTMFTYPQLQMFDWQEGLQASALKPVGALEMCSVGFISPFGREEKELLSHEVGRCVWMAIGAEEKILPPAVVSNLLDLKLQDIEEQEGRRPGGRERKRIKDDLLHELLPRAFVRPTRTDLYLDHQRGVVFVDTSSRKTGEAAMSQLRNVVGSFPALPLNAEVSPRAILTSWVAGEPLPEGLSLGEECELRDPVEGGAIVRCQHHELRCDEVDLHLETGKQVTKLALVLDDHLSFVLGDDLIVRKLRFLDGALDQLDQGDEDGRRAELDTRFALQIGEVGRLYDLVREHFRLTTYA
ncbi:recombination-associated protein RdgC [Stenotrophomonas maltophilia]|uniref:recombination-associated protein RdgC n=1 Tax=Stenotrophomonas maltophilia TaxID=40324 RepID=UPI0013D95031|nr:recombination-associated protein RdgC [Stenotrophomonas maltophilia]MBN4978839.1 recombination-associated protein RdgC [Stenotrophomonas maltophilia]NRP02011.1 recombination-associated protein RdgC [Stenotrophomonas maltophilia]